MKKAQWKQDPRERAFGKDAREVLNAKLSAYVAELEQTLAHTRARHRAQQDRMEENLQNYADRVQDMSAMVTAYKFLRQEGVVLTHNEEFKHLKGEDMDAFFGIAPLKTPQGLWQQAMTALNNKPTKTIVPSILQQDVEKLLNAAFEKSFNEYMLNNTDANKVTFSEEITSPWLPLQKQK